MHRLLAGIAIALLLLGGALYAFWTEYHAEDREKSGILEAIRGARDLREKVARTRIKDLIEDKTLLEDAITLVGVRPLMEKLVAESQGGSAFDCHQEAHEIGRIGYQIENEKAFGECDASCHSGCYHGAMETLLSQKGTANLSGVIKSTCESFETVFGNFECLHGVGHGVLAYFDYDLPDTLAECTKLYDTFAQSSCYGGAFMENILTAQGYGAKEKNHETEWASDDPHFPCNAVDTGYEVRYQCYQMQTSWMLTLFDYDFNKVAAECLKAPRDMIEVCFRSYGRDAAGQSLRDPQKIVPLCKNIPREYYEACILGAVYVILDFWGPGISDQAVELCRFSEPAGKPACYASVASRYTDIFPEDLKKARCESFEREYRNLCL